jgi:hypothetical protein
MADFAHWISACETALWPPGTFARAYAQNRRAAIENIVDGDPVASRIRDLMARHKIWTGTAADLLRVGLEGSGHGKLGRCDWLAQEPARAGWSVAAGPAGFAFAGHRHRFSREGPAGTRTITIRWSIEQTVGTVSSSAARSR